MTRGFDLTQSSAFPALLIKAVDCKRRTKNAVLDTPWDSKLHQIDFAIDRTCLYDKIKAKCSEIYDKNTLQQ